MNNKLDKKFPLNSINKSNSFFYRMKVRHIGIEIMEKIKNKNEDDKLFLTCSNMIGHFNIKTNKILDISSHQ
jgi:predicted RNA-binding protein